MIKEINSISQLVEHLHNDIGLYAEDIWFRGQSQFDWKLIPGRFRDKEQYSESTLLTRFKQSAALLIDTSPKDDFDWLFLMQHYGMPTRLLDWTESPLTALYFALESNNFTDYDSALWLLKPIELNKNANIRTNEKNFIPSFDDEHLKNYNIESINSNKRLELNAIATIATRNNSRIQAQLGVFTIHHLDPTAIEDFCTKDEVIKYKIPAEAKKTLKKELDLLSVNKFTLFPELSSISEIIKKRLK